MASSIFIDAAGGFSQAGGVVTSTFPVVLPPGLDLQFGGTTASFPALKQVGTALLVRTADDSATGDINAGTFNVVTKVANSSGVTLFSMTAPTISSGFGTSPSIANSNGTASFTVNVGTGGTATSGVIGLPTATNGWVALCTDVTANAAHTALQTVQTASATNSVTIESQNRSTGAATAWATGSVIRVSCFAF